MKKEKNNIKSILEEYKVKIEKRKELLEILKSKKLIDILNEFEERPYLLPILNMNPRYNHKSIEEVIKVFENSIYSEMDEDIMLRVLKKYDIVSEKSLLYNEGIFFLIDRDDYYEDKFYIREEDIEKIRNDKVLWDYNDRRFIANIYCDFVTREVFYSYDFYKSDLFLPSTANHVNNLEKYSDHHSLTFNLEDSDLRKRYNIAAIQFWLMMANYGEDYAFNYYNNKNNGAEIENKINQYVRKKTFKYFDGFSDYVEFRLNE